MTQFLNLPCLAALDKNDLIKQTDTEHVTLHHPEAEQSSVAVYQYQDLSGKEIIRARA